VLDNSSRTVQVWGKVGPLLELFLKTHQLGRKKAVWVSVSLELNYDVVRDLKDIGTVGQINVHALKVFLTIALLYFFILT
jgi:uncharacterized protein YpiB (UPF0302 family)